MSSSVAAAATGSPVTIGEGSSAQAAESISVIISRNSFFISIPPWLKKYIGKI